MRIAIAFTGGKDSTLVASGYQLLSCPERRKLLPQEFIDRLTIGLPDASGQNVQVSALVTFTPEGGAKSFKAHPAPVIEALAQCLELPLIVKTILGPDYLGSYITAIRELAAEHQIDALATGDILDVCSNFMGRAAEGADMPLLRPLWGIPRREMLNLIWALDIKPIITCVNVHKFTPKTATPVTSDAAPADSTAAKGQSPSSAEDGAACHGSGADSNGHYSCMQTREGPMQPAHPEQEMRVDAVEHVLGQALTPEFHASVLLAGCQTLGVDECGEYGEYHTMCLDGPTFKSQLALVTEKAHQPGEEYAYLTVSSVHMQAKPV